MTPRAQSPNDGVLARTGMLPTFLIIGAMKSGTTSLYRYLRSHPHIFMPDTKEMDFFVAERNWTRGRQWYEGQFAAAGAAQARGEASPVYSMYPEFEGVPERIAGLIPDVKLIYVLRDPVDRIRSHYQHLFSRGRERLPIEDAVRADPRYLDTSRYAAQIDRYMRYFPREALLLVMADDLLNRRKQALRTVCEFIGVDPEWSHPDLKREYHRSWRKWTLAAAHFRLRRLRAHSLPSRLVPRTVKGVYYRFHRRSFGTLDAPDALRRYVTAELSDDLDHLREFAGPAVDAWRSTTDG